MYNISNSSVIYVSQTRGNDRLNGFSPKTDGYGNGPVKTLERAFRAVAELRVTGMKRPMTVSLTEDYYMDRPITLSSEITGVTLRSHGGRKRLIGGVRITGWRKDTYRGVSCLSAVLPAKSDGSVWDFTDLYVNGVRADSPRYPKSGTLKAVQTETETGALYGSSKWFIANKSDLASVEGLEDAIVNYYHWWVDAHTPIEKYDPETGILTMAYESRFAINTMYAAGDEEENSGALHYYLTNVPTMFSEKNEWYLDRKTGVVYYIPEDTCVDPASVEAYAPVIPHFFEIETTDIHICDLELMCTRGEYISKVDYWNETEAYAYNPDAAYASDIQSVCWAPGAISYRNAARCSIRSCFIHGVGIHAVEIKTGCQNIRIENNRIEDICAGGVKIFGGEAWDAPEMMTGNCIVRGNTITRCGRRYAAGVGVLVCHAANNEISENEISYLDYSGISVGWIWGYAESTSYGNIIRGNHIHHIGMGLLSDMGGIYTLGIQPGTVISENRIHDVINKNYGGWGIYTDEGSSCITIENNVIYNTKTESYHQHYGSFNTVRNNIFAFGGSVARVSRNELHDGILFEGNIYLTDGAPMYGEHTSLCTMASAKNILWDISGDLKLMKKPDGTYYTFEEWTSKCGKDAGSVACDPGFRDAKNYDFTLDSDSNAVQNGFTPLTGFLASGKK